MRGKGRARIVLFATVGIDACVWLNGCAKAGNPDDELLVDAAPGSSGGPSTGRDGGASAQAISSDDAMGAGFGEASYETATDDGTSDSGAPKGDDDSEGHAGSEGESGVAPVADAGDASNELLGEGGYDDYPDASSSSADATVSDATTPAPEASVVEAGGAGADAGSASESGVDAAIDAPAPVDAGADVACGGCAAGFSCGPGGYCVSSTGVPAFGHVYVIVMEEQSLS